VKEFLHCLFKPTPFKGSAEARPAKQKKLDEMVI
jgi:hypothetical protein